MLTFSLQEKPLVSILTTNKSPQESGKHVHFSIPEISAPIYSGKNTVSFTTPSLDRNNSNSHTSTALSTPSSSPVERKSSECKQLFKIGSNYNHLPSLTPKVSSRNTNEKTSVLTSLTIVKCTLETAKQ